MNDTPTPPPQATQTAAQINAPQVGQADVKSESQISNLKSQIPPQAQPRASGKFAAAAKPARVRPELKVDPNAPKPKARSTRHAGARGIRGAKATVSAAIAAHKELDPHVKALLAGKIDAVKGDFVEVHAHSFQEGENFTLHVHVRKLF